VYLIYIFYTYIYVEYKRNIKKEQLVEKYLCVENNYLESYIGSN
jgi:hypothetical protein